ncbi:hypothetical protein EV196_101526 [Mariniflexile fucanivorans]|uniref:Uncharacterized protein n=1 Tax=Mariniflexile fucanivorans TaxID=264023 RepID=A0A4R1RRX7_9FLAO|nr:hypothetical protein [Mariniflexile fucanivorans]TCL69094.1 hypothetical protein EV196_101526 [Mariniflexile fucanivorans]
MRKLYLLLFITCLFLMAFQCEDDAVSTQETEQQDLLVSKKAIEDLAATSVCNDSFTCKFIALGSKPCGGPWGYLIYSTSINIEKLENMVAAYNKKEAEYNNKWDVFSDCAYAMPPTSLKCENNICVAVY